MFEYHSNLQIVFFQLRVSNGLSKSYTVYTGINGIRDNTGIPEYRNEIPWKLVLFDKRIYTIGNPDEVFTNLDEPLIQFH